MTSHTQDDAFHEIQLGGKQLAFLFMAATLVSVVIFLCGVFVGRGVRAERGVLADTETAPQAVATGDPLAPPVTPAGAEPAAASRTPDDLTYLQRLEQANTPREELKPSQPSDQLAATSSPAPVASPVAAPRVEPPPVVPPPARTPDTASTIPPTAAAPPSGGFVAQVSAVKNRADADKLAKRLSGKGYTAFVQPAGAVFRVRVGPYKTKQDAQAAADRLHAEDQFTPFVTR